MRIRMRKDAGGYWRASDAQTQGLEKMCVLPWQSI